MKSFNDPHHFITGAAGFPLCLLLSALLWSSYQHDHTPVEDSSVVAVAALGAEQ